ncbi:MAG TPA: alpha/beta hydrolase, partial [Nevskiaceae bacterium]|nr:alpha/beta hydrolase [Nevskiaceae bacterium]
AAANRMTGVSIERRGAFSGDVNPEDVSLAIRWVRKNIARYGGDPNHIVVAGESAGGNLALSVAVASSYRRPEPWAQMVYDARVRPLAVQPIMPYLQVSNPARHSLNAASGFMALDVAHDIAAAYLGRRNTQASAETLMADPIRVLEECGAPERPLPQVWSCVGTADLCCEDVHRLEMACKKHDVPAQIDYYENEIHAFHAFRWRPAAQRFWRQNFEFLEELAAPAL